MEGCLAPVNEREELGKAVVKAVFGAGSSRVVAGCAVTEGKLTNVSKPSPLGPCVCLARGCGFSMIAPNVAVLSV